MNGGGWGWEKDRGGDLIRRRNLRGYENSRGRYLANQSGFRYVTLSRFGARRDEHITQGPNRLSCLRVRSCVLYIYILVRVYYYIHTCIFLSLTLSLSLALTLYAQTHALNVRVCIFRCISAIIRVPILFHTYSTLRLSRNKSTTIKTRKLLWNPKARVLIS